MGIPILIGSTAVASVILFIADTALNDERFIGMLPMIAAYDILCGAAP
jgi:hypothetical protein